MKTIRACQAIVHDFCLGSLKGPGLMMNVSTKDLVLLSHCVEAIAFNEPVVERSTLRLEHRGNRAIHGRESSTRCMGL